MRGFYTTTAFKEFNHINSLYNSSHRSTTPILSRYSNGPHFPREHYYNWPDEWTCTPLQEKLFKQWL